eukprot:CCRYP_012647-RA/>CCRYP_012647-RA protein AED:0.04 eAED:0.04 QI:189/1/1/1/1/1/3/735/355
MAVNKMFVMLPVMLAARKLDGEDPNIVFLLRCLYGAVQTIALILVLFVYTKASAAAADKANDVLVYVPPPPQPFAAPEAKKTYQEKSLSNQLISGARGLVGSTVFGVCMTVGLHLWKGMIVGLAIQSVMAPFNLYENPLVQAVFLKGGFANLKEKRIFGEKRREEIDESDLVTDDQGNTIVLKQTASKSKKDGGEKNGSKSFEDILLDTWDLGEEADIAALMSALTKNNINNATKENAWTPIMIMSGLGASGVGEALKRMRDLGANPEIVDKEGWNALHWAAFHGSAEAARVLLEKDVYDGITLGLHTVADKEGKTPVDLARDEKNDDVTKAIKEAAENATDLAAGAKDGMRKRK